jgi:SLT domain-containing protein
LLACPAIRKALPDDTPAAEGMGPGKRAILAYYARPNGERHRMAMVSTGAASFGYLRGRLIEDGFLERTARGEYVVTDAGRTVLED